MELAAAVVEQRGRHCRTGDLRSVLESPAKQTGVQRDAFGITVGASCERGRPRLT